MKVKGNESILQKNNFSKMHAEEENKCDESKKSDLVFDIENYELSGTSSCRLSQGTTGSNMDRPPLQDYFDVSSLLRAHSSSAVSNYFTSKTTCSGQLRKASALVRRNVASNDAKSSVHVLRTSNGSNPQSKNTSPMGFSKLLSYCNKTDPLAHGTNARNGNLSTDHNKTSPLVLGDGIKSEITQSVKRKVQNNTITSTLFTVKDDDDDNLSDSDLDPDWDPLAKKKKS